MRGDGVGAFRTVCEFSHMNYDDAIVYPRQPGKAHLHTYFGNTGMNANSTRFTIRLSGNSTCRGGTVNRTGYWVPTLLTADGKPVAPDYMDVYYKSGYNGISPSEIQVFPGDLRMIAGDMRSSSRVATSSSCAWREGESPRTTIATRARDSQRFIMALL